MSACKQPADGADASDDMYNNDIASTMLTLYPENWWTLEQKSKVGFIDFAYMTIMTIKGTTSLLGQ